jgi:double zinc ribbon protein
MNERPDIQEALCPVCGSPLAQGAQFCGACGSHAPSPFNPYDAPTTPDGIPSEGIASTAPGIFGLAIESGIPCMACGAVNIPGVERCAACGALLLDEATDSRWQTEPGRNGNQP